MAAYIDVIGNLTRDPELKQTPTGNAACDISIASNARGRDGERTATYFTCRIFGKQAETCSKYLAKGRTVYVRGEFAPYTYTTRDGETRTAYGINNAHVDFVSAGTPPPDVQPTSDYKRAAPSARSPQPEESEDDLPF